MIGAILGGASGAAVVALAIVRVRNLARARAADAAQPPRRLLPGGVVAGAEGFTLDAPGDRVLLLLHGFNDTPQSVAALARALHERGWTVRVPLLAHHGRMDDENARAGRADEWIEQSREAWRALCARSDRAVLAGQSMGGAIATILAAEHAPAALVLLAPYFEMGRFPRFVAATWRLSSLVVPRILSDARRGLRDPDARARSLSRGQFTPRLLNELRRVVNAARPAAARLHAPTLVVQGRVDYRIPSASAQRGFDRLAATDKTMRWLDDVGHVVAADTGRAHVGDMVGDWLDERVPAR